MEVDERRTPEDELGPVLAAGRDAAVHALGDDRVLRRTPSAARDLRAEAAIMEHVRAAGYPAPQVFRVGPGEMVLERIEGPTMLEAIEAKVWQVDRHARTLADLHTRLHVLPPPADLAHHAESALAGDAIVHQDLHPGNVLLSAAGPVVIDWTNARRADPDADVALTWLLMAAFDHDQPPPAGSLPHRLVTMVERAAEPRLRARLVRTFVRSSGREAAARALLPAVARHRLHDPNVRPGEADAIRTLVARETGDSLPT
ncbi:MAG: phosphotransferase [Acidimicrobiales bacterium]|nr:phosphotransferase [Acidimicrobiales bacterium]